MINSGQLGDDVPVVDWQAESIEPYKLFRLEELRGTAPSDGHDPKQPHRIGFHALMLVTEGGFEHGFDFQITRFSRNQLVYIAPNQVHHFVKSRRAHKACILAFRPELLPAELLQVDGNRIPWSIMCYRWPAVTKLKAIETRLLEEQLGFLDRMKSMAPASNSAAVKYHLCGLIALAFELAKQNHGERSEWRSDRRFLDFVQLVEESFTIRRDVSWYAKKMDCSQRTLNRLCQRMLGKTAKLFLSERVVIEAKRLLAYEVDSVSEVAQRLGFSSATNFTRYFGSETGMTPGAFKEPIDWPRELSVTGASDLERSF